MPSYVWNGEPRETREIAEDEWHATEAWLCDDIDRHMSGLSFAVARRYSSAMPDAIQAANSWETLQRLRLRRGLFIMYRHPLDPAGDLFEQLIEIAKGYHDCRRICVTQRAYNLADVLVSKRDANGITDGVRYLSGNPRVYVQVVPYLSDDVAEILD